MTLVTLRNDHWIMEIVPEIGAGVYGLSASENGQWVPILRRTPPEALAEGNASRLASFTLAPWSNAIKNSRFEFQGKSYMLKANNPAGGSQHGDVRRRPWRIIERDATTLVCEFESRQYPDFNFPFPIRCRIAYRLDGGLLRTDFILQNDGEKDMPAGFGFHPYFYRSFGGEGVDEVELEFRAGGVYPPSMEEGLESIGPDLDFSGLRRLGEQDIDHCFGGWDGAARIVYPAAGRELRITADACFAHVVLFAPPGKPYFAFEPVTHANNGINFMVRGEDATGVRILQPGGELRGGFQIRMEAKPSR